MGGRHKYSGVLRGASGGLLATLLSPLQCHSTLGTVPFTLAWVEH